VATQTKAAQAKEDLYDGKHLIISERQVDKFTTTRSRIVLTEGVCDICGLDILDNSGSDREWGELTKEEQANVMGAVAKHKEVVHTPHSKLIVTEDQVPTSYLSGRKKKRKR
jgi:hypothetical protein